MKIKEWIDITNDLSSAYQMNIEQTNKVIHDLGMAFHKVSLVTFSSLAKLQETIEYYDNNKELSNLEKVFNSTLFKLLKLDK